MSDVAAGGNSIVGAELVVSMISRQEMERRAWDLRQFRHSTEMEGGRLSEETERDLAQYVRGDVDEVELLRRVRERTFGRPD